MGGKAGSPVNKKLGITAKRPSGRLPGEVALAGAAMKSFRPPTVADWEKVAINCVHWPLDSEQYELDYPENNRQKRVAYMYAMTTHVVG